MSDIQGEPARPVARATSPDAVPELTVSMPARNAAPYIRQAIASALRQTDVALELLVVDDASTDDTAAVVTACKDPRLRLLRNSRQMGIAACHNVVLRESRAPYVAHVDADDFLLPGALRKMIAALDSNPRIGQAHCYFLDVDEHGRTTHRVFAQRWHLFRRKRPPTMDYASRLVHAAGVINHLRTYRRAALEELGGFNEQLRFGEDYEMALRLLDRYTITLVPEFLYCRRVHRGSTTGSLRFRFLRLWAQRYRTRRQLIRSGRVQFLPGARFNLLSDIHQVTVDRLRSVLGWARGTLRRGIAVVRWRLAAPAWAIMYRATIRRCAWWPLGWRTVRLTLQTHGAKRIAYYQHAFPVASETFVQREVAALIHAGVEVDVVAYGAVGVEHFNADARALMERTRYLEAPSAARVAPAAWRLFQRHPLTFANLLLYAVFTQYDARKWIRRDLQMFLRAVYVADALRDRGITHVHAPWAGLDAFVAMLAARLLRVPYTVQARAYDLHMDSSAHGRKERLDNADTVITNSQYNLEVITALLGARARGKVRRIYNGIDLTRFPLNRTPRLDGSVPRILCVARLVPAKGIEYLLQACRILKDAGWAVHCEIIGGRVPEEINYYLVLQKLRRALALEQEVQFLGTQSFDRVMEKYREADLVVLPSVIAADGSGDVTPNALIEAMAMRLPVVSTRSRAIPEIVEDGVSGLLVEPRDAAALVAAILRLLRDPALREELGNSARRRIEERFDISRNISDYVSLFLGDTEPTALTTPAGAAARAPGSDTS